MTTLYQYFIRYYRIGKQKRYITMESPYFAFEDICSESMRETLRMIGGSDDYNIDSYYVSAVLVDTVEGLNVLTDIESALPF